MEAFFMKKVKEKVIVIGMAAILAVSCFTGCGNSKTAEQTNTDIGTEKGIQSNEKNQIITQENNDNKGLDYESKAFTEDMVDYSVTAQEEPISFQTEEYNAVNERGFLSAADYPLSTLSIDVDTASYSNIRRQLKDGTGVDAGSVRIEEMINYFQYDYQKPNGKDPFGVTTEFSDCPWNKDSKLLLAGIATEEIDFSNAPASNLVFLLDVSGSMNEPNKLPLVQKAFKLLANHLTEKDRISIVTYASGDEVLLEGANGKEYQEIQETIESLSAGGGTAGSQGIQTAYSIAEKYFIKGGNNRVILATDGDLNIGISSESQLKKLIEEKRETGVFLSVLGFGTGNLKDNKLETLADYGNGNYAYIDSYNEAKKVLVEEMGAAMVTVAKDVKLQVEFNPEYVKGYRLIGYENRMLDSQDFADDTKDAGELGAGHTVTVLYEVVLTDSKMEIPASDLKYQDKKDNEKQEDNGELLTIDIRYKEPTGDTSKLLSFPVRKESYQKDMSSNLNFASAVAQFGMLLRDSEYKGTATYDGILKQVPSEDISNDKYKKEFLELVKLAKEQNIGLQK